MMVVCIVAVCTEKCMIDLVCLGVTSIGKSFYVRNIPEKHLKQLVGGDLFDSIAANYTQYNC